MIKISALLKQFPRDGWKNPSCNVNIHHTKGFPFFFSANKDIGGHTFILHFWVTSLDLMSGDPPDYNLSVMNRVIVLKGERGVEKERVERRNVPIENLEHILTAENPTEELQKLTVALPEKERGSYLNMMRRHFFI